MAFLERSISKNWQKIRLIKNEKTLQRKKALIAKPVQKACYFKIEQKVTNAIKFCEKKVIYEKNAFYPEKMKIQAINHKNEFSEKYKGSIGSDKKNEDSKRNDTTNKLERHFSSVCRSVAANNSPATRKFFLAYNQIFSTETNRHKRN